MAVANVLLLQDCTRFFQTKGVEFMNVTIDRRANRHKSLNFFALDGGRGSVKCGVW